MRVIPTRLPLLPRLALLAVIIASIIAMSRWMPSQDGAGTTQDHSAQVRPIFATWTNAAPTLPTATGPSRVHENLYTSPPDVDDPDTVSTYAPPTPPRQTDEPTLPPTPTPRLHHGNDAPTEVPTKAPVMPTVKPTSAAKATEAPSMPRTSAPTTAPPPPTTEAPTHAPTAPKPTRAEVPTHVPTTAPPRTPRPTTTEEPPTTEAPTDAPTDAPTAAPPRTPKPTKAEAPTNVPTKSPTAPPTSPPAPKPPKPTAAASTCTALLSPENAFTSTGSYYLSGSWVPVGEDGDERGGVPLSRYVPAPREAREEPGGPDSKCTAVFAGTSSRVTCKWTDDMPHRVWQPAAAECRGTRYFTDRLQLQRFVRFLRHNALAIVGDSLSRQTAHVLQCQLSAAGFSEEDRGHLLTQFVNYGISFAETLDQDQPTCVEDVMERIDDIPLNDYLNMIYNTPTAELLRKADQSAGYEPPADDDDDDEDMPRGVTVLVVNVGAWYNNYKLRTCGLSDDDIEVLHEQTVRRIFAEIPRAQRVRAERALELGVPDRLVVVYRTILPSGCVTVDNPHADNGANPAFMWHMTPVRNNVIRLLAREYGALLLDPEEALQTRNDAKVSYHAPSADSSFSSDCTHYCVGPGSPINTAIEAMLRMLDVDLHLLPPIEQ